MLGTIKVIATCFLIVGVGGANGAFMQSSRSADKPPTIVVTSSGSDATCRRGVRSKPCATLNKAYSLARCGDIAEIAAGSYGSQKIIETRTGSACNGNPIVFRPAPRTRPKINWIQFGDCSVCFSHNAPDNLTLRGFRVTQGFSIWGDAVNVTLDDIDGGSFFIEGATNMKIINSDWGPCGSRAIAGDCRNYYPGDGYSGQVRIIKGTNLLFENNAFHDMLQERPGDHWECIFMNPGGLTNVTFRGNRFYNCQTNAIALGNGGNPANVAGTWLIENNWFGACPGGTLNGGGPYCLNLTSLPVAATIIVRFNSFAPGEYLGCESGCGNPQGRLRVVGNIFGSGSACISGGAYRDNLFLNPGSGCGQIARTSVFGYTYNDGRLLTNRRAADAVRTAFAEVGARKIRSLRVIARRLSKRRKPAPPGGWNASSVRAIVSDSVYLGRRLGIQARHPRLVSPSLWRKAQRALATTGR